MSWYVHIGNKSIARHSLSIGVDTLVAAVTEFVSSCHWDLAVSFALTGFSGQLVLPREGNLHTLQICVKLHADWLQPQVLLKLLYTC